MSRITSDVGPWSVVPEWLLDADVTDRAVRLFAVLGRYANAHEVATPSRTTLATRLGCSVDSIDRAVRELTGIGAVEAVGRVREDGSQTSNIYKLFFAAPEQRERREVAAPARRKAAAPRNESHIERERASELPNSAAASDDLMPPKKEPRPCQADADAMARRVWDARKLAGRTAGTFVAYRSVLEESLVAGADPERLERAAIKARAVSRASIEYELSAETGNGRAPSTDRGSTERIEL